MSDPSGVLLQWLTLCFVALARWSVEPYQPSGSWTGAIRGTAVTFTLHAGGVDHLPQSFLERAWGSRRSGWLKIERPVWLPAARYIAKKIVPIDECAQEPEWGMWPGNFMQAIRRVRRQAKERQREGIYLYDAGGRAVNAKEAMS